MSFRAFPLVAAGVALLIAGCSGGGDSSGAATSSAATAKSGGTSKAQPTTEPVGDDAVGRYETYLHAIGNRDVATACEIGRPAAEESRGSSGPCEQSMKIQFGMYDPDEMKAMRGAKVDKAGITESPTRVEIPTGAVKVDVELIETELNDAVMELRDGKWYRVK
ncbi:hypothetical protein M8542_08430 [Amycolatopsis sp. OK19-0408]|uniref:Lipoprotein n=1 Tax=Amycolatopsis iheyensis TaxID=2945988 RepID=A0A9X2SHK8_9PSEU|nr:hypothetical protein [Amycolatopsis iheyensis]MCR6482842.1 hypothetical protein [Amycolatopsis iheyensis]